LKTSAERLGEAKHCSYIDGMNIGQLQLLKDILSVPTKTHQEERLVDFLVGYFDRKEVGIMKDDMGNLMIVKGEADYYPCVVAHTDTVHHIDGEIDIRTVQRPNTCGDMRTALTGFKPGTDDPTGCGGDDKAGVFICLQLFEMFDNIKLFFPVAEETGCHGSKAVDSQWFDDVGYIIQFDSPTNNTMSRTLLGRTLYDDQDGFSSTVMGLITEHGITEHQAHPYTDVATLGERFELQCLNLAAGYYKMHRAEEYVIIDDVINAITLGTRLIDRLGEKQYAKRLEEQTPVRILGSY
jgi:putative aminopeptidase FrvX|tara:strand:+ start:56 stop:940 length:885 start_codon:yes stop_codon:yes gene_type:complete